jgi:dihydroxyacetone kinase-like protein
MAFVENAGGRPILLAMVKAVQQGKQYLSDVDGLVGDGDHGANMNKGFTMYQEQLGARDTSFSDGLYDLGSVLLNKIGGSMGPIYGTVFMEMSDRAEDAEKIDLPLFCNMMEAGLEGLYDIVEARPGDKTLVDTLYPALTALKAAKDAGAPFTDALDGMKAAAEKGRDSTKELVARYGRSARLGERSRGVLDAGAVSCALILGAMADAMKSALQE